MADETFDPQNAELTPRSSTLQDLVDLCKKLQEKQARFIVIGGFAIQANGLARMTYNIDLLIDTSAENEKKVFDVLLTLPDGCARELESGDVAKYNVVRVADEFVVDLLASTSGITYEDAVNDVLIRKIDGIPIPFAGPELLYRMKKRTGREKDRGDVFFLEELFAAQGKKPPAY